MFTVRLALSTPASIGAKVTAIVQNEFAASVVQIHSAPHFSLQIFGDVRESIEIRACPRDLRSRGPRESLGRRKSPESSKTYPGAIFARSADHRLRFACRTGGRIRADLTPPFGEGYKKLSLKSSWPLTLTG
jgi:hypothetical protein